MNFTIEGRIPSKKNSKRIVMFGKRPAIITSKDYQVWHEGALYALNLQMPKNLVLTGPYRIEILLVAPNRIRGDLTNKAESLMDLLVDGEIIPDDNWKMVPELLLKFGGVDKTNPRAEIKVEQIKKLKANGKKS